MPKPAKQRRTLETGLLVSIVVHAIAIGGLVFLAAREGFLGKQLKTIAVTMVPKEKPPEPEKPKEPEKQPEPPVTPPQAEPPPPVAATTPPPAAPPPSGPPPVATTAPAAAPPPVGLPAFTFSDGAKVVETSSNPVQLYKSFVEFAIRSKWIRPEGIEDREFVAEVEVQLNEAGRVLGSTWKRGSGNPAWDQSVKQAVARTPSISRPPPKGFPSTFIVRFDVVEETDANTLGVP